MPNAETVAEFIRETAQAVIMPRFRTLRGEDIREKGPGDLVTIADLESERLLTRRLMDALPGSVVVGEEAVAKDPSRLGLLMDESPTWVIDPVDGTANFARGKPGFAVIVARVECGVVKAGWIYDPLNDVMVVAEAGNGAWSGGGRLKAAGEVAIAEMIGAAYGRTAAGPRSAQTLADSGRIGRVHNHGCSGLEYMELALGRAQFSLHSRSLPWDHAAGMLITVEAGGVAFFFDGTPYDPRIANRPLLAAANQEMWDTVQEVVGALV